MSKRLLRAVVIPLSLTFLFYTPGFAQSGKEDIQEIAIVSLFGDNFVGRRISEFKKNKLWFAPVPEWGVNEAAQKTILEFLEGQPDITGAPLPPEGYENECLLKRYVKKECLNSIMSEVSKAGYDYVLLVAPYTISSNKYEGGGALDVLAAELFSSDVTGGYGYYRRGQIKCVFALFSMGVYDVQTGKSYGSIKDNEKGGFIKSGFPCYSKRYRDKKTEDKISWQDNFDGYSLREKELMKGYILKGVEEDLFKILPKLKLFKE